MKKIIEGRVYNTDTAERVGAWDNGYPANDFNYCSEDLYRKKTGEFFLHGDGGAMSKYSVSVGNNWTGGEKIVPLTYEMAREWAEKNLSAEKHDELFGEIKEDDGKRAVNISLTITAHEKLKQVAAQRNTIVSAVIEKLIEKL